MSINSVINPIVKNLLSLSEPAIVSTSLHLCFQAEPLENGTAEATYAIVYQSPNEMTPHYSVFHNVLS